MPPCSRYQGLGEANSRNDRMTNRQKTATTDCQLLFMSEVR